MWNQTSLLDVSFSIETRDKQPALLLYQTMCIADSVCVLSLSRGPYGGITGMEQSVNREERENWHLYGLMTTHPWCNRLWSRFYGGAFSPFVVVCGGPTSSFVASGKKGCWFQTANCCFGDDPRPWNTNFGETYTKTKTKEKIRLKA